MPRPLRIDPGDICYHVINRGNGGATVFRKPEDFAAFTRVLSLACEFIDVRILAWCLMPNHFHLVLWPRKKGALSRWMQWVTTCHVRRYHRHYHGSGHVWQGRYKAFAAQGDKHLLAVLRYVERNPVRAGLTAKAQDWPWSSARFSGSRLVAGLAENGATESGIDTPRPARPLQEYLVPGPVKRPKPWLTFVNRVEDAAELLRLRVAVNRGKPYGDRNWETTMAKKLGLQSTLRPRGRPPKKR